MKFFHISDLHIGLKLYNRDLYEDQAFVLRQVVEAAGRIQPDAVVIAGDIYDKAAPSAEAVEFFDAFLTDLVKTAPQTEIMIISGNHDSAARLNLFRGILSHQNIHMIGEPPRRETDYIEKVRLKDDYGPVNFYLLPFVKPSMARMIVGTDENGSTLSYQDTLRLLLEREKINTSERNVLVSHQFYLPTGVDADSVARMDSEMRTVGNIDAVGASLLAGFDYAALGHIHKPMSVGSPRYRYAGTPLACSVSEAGQQKGFLIVTLREKGNVSVEKMPLSPLHEIRIIRGTLEEVLRLGCDDYVKVILTDQTDLDVFDLQDRLRDAFPHLLETSRERAKSEEDPYAYTPQGDLDPFALCCSFLKDPTQEEQNLLKDLINSVQGVGES